jgi:DNA-binding helix-hairpin-helix protein with protein kinase domain
MLHSGARVDLRILGPATVVQELGQGGQGYVYEVERSDGTSLALKWYKPQCATKEQYDDLGVLVEQGSPHERFLWPLDLATVRGEQGFGYVMPVRHSRFIELGHLVSGKGPDGEGIDVSFASVINLCRQLADSFRRLHARGMCYRDISFGNVLFDPATGDIVICDNDNVGIDNGRGRVLGTPFFTAPEVIRDLSYRTLPNTETDRHSLAVLLFYALCVGHPLEGRKTEQGLRDQNWLAQHFGTDPTFVFHPTDDSNRPTSALVQAYWDRYPAFLHDAFIRAFTDGLHDPMARVTESEWITIADRLADGMMLSDAGDTVFWDAYDPDRVCRHAGHKLVPPFVLHVGRRRIAVSPFAQVREDHLSSSGRRTAVARARQHPADQRRWGLHNVSQRQWHATQLDGTVYAVEPQQTIEITPGLRVDLRPGLVAVPG